MALQELIRHGCRRTSLPSMRMTRVCRMRFRSSGFRDCISRFTSLSRHLFKNADKSLEIDSDHMMVISPDEGGMGRAVYLANVLGLDMGMFYKRRDYTQDRRTARNPIVAHEFLGSDVEGKDGCHH